MPWVDAASRTRFVDDGSGRFSSGPRHVTGRFRQPVNAEANEPLRSCRLDGSPSSGAR